MLPCEVTIRPTSNRTAPGSRTGNNIKKTQHAQQRSWSKISHAHNYSSRCFRCVETCEGNQLTIVPSPSIPRGLTPSNYQTTNNSEKQYNSLRFGRVEIRAGCNISRQECRSCRSLGTRWQSSLPA